MSGPRRLRSYALTGGRTHVDATLSMETLLVSRGVAVDPHDLSPEQADILQLCATPQSLVDLSARLDLPLGVIRVLVGDLLALGHITKGDDATTAALPPHQDIDVLSDLLDGIEAL